MKRFVQQLPLVILAALLMTNVTRLTTAKEDANAFDKKIQVERVDRATVEVKGVACSFCAYGTEKNLARLKFVNPVEEEFGGDGVLLDVKRGRIVLAIHPERKVTFDEIAQAITKGGYTFVAAHVKLVGTLVRDKEKRYLVNVKNNQRFLLRAAEGELWTDDALIGQEVVIQAVVPASDVNLKKTKEAPKTDSEQERPTPVRVKTIERLKREAS